MAEVLTGVIGACFLLHSASSRNWQWLRAPWMMILLLLWLQLTLSGLLSPDVSEGLKRGLLWGRFPLLTAALVFWILPDDATQRRVLMSLVFTVLALTADMLWQDYTGFDIMGRARIDMPSFVRLTGPYSNPRAGITLLWLCFPAIFFGLAFLRERVPAGGKRVVLYIAALVVTALIAIAIHGSGERMAFLFLSFGIVLAALLSRPLRWFFAVLGLSMMLLLSVAAHQQPVVLDYQVNRAAGEIASINHSIYGRLWVSSVRIVQDAPLLGVGPKQFRHACPDAKYGSEGIDAPEHRCAMHPHNIYLELMAETGLPALILFGAAVLYWLRLCWRAREQVMADPILCGLFIAFVVRIWPIASTPSFFAPWVVSPLWFLLALLLARLALRRS